MPKPSWHLYEDDLLIQSWGTLMPSDLAASISRLGSRRTTRAVVERARVLSLPTPGVALKTICSLATATGYSPKRIRTAMTRLRIRPRRRGAWYAITAPQQERILEFLASQLDGQKIMPTVQGEWGGPCHRGGHKPDRCIDCGTTARPHFCRGRCKRCDAHWRRVTAVAS